MNPYSSRKAEHGAAIKAVLVLIILFLIVVAAVAYTFGRVIYPGEMGIRQITVGPYQGFSRVALPPGYHWNVPYYSKIHAVPRTVQIMHLHREHLGSGDEHGYLEVQTTDGASVYVDISLLYRFYAGDGAGDGAGDKHGGPFELITEIGTERLAWINRIQTAAINELKKSLGHLSTSDFYNPDLRDREVGQAEERINARLRRFGINVDTVLLRRYTYAEQRIDEAIFQKNLQDQEERLNAAAKARAEAEAVLEKVAAEGDAKIKTQLVKGENEAKIIRSEADLYEEQRSAAADLLVAKAVAEVQRQRAEVLAMTTGADVYVAKELAVLLSSLQGGVLSGVDPYDLPRWLDRLGIEGEQ